VKEGKMTDETELAREVLETHKPGTKGRCRECFDPFACEMVRLAEWGLGLAEDVAGALGWDKATLWNEAMLPQVRRGQEAIERLEISEAIIRNAEGHPDMCCGQCGQAIAAAERRAEAAERDATRLRVLGRYLCEASTPTQVGEAARRASADPEYRAALQPGTTPEATTEAHDA
jgi:hypothetical protein